MPVKDLLSCPGKLAAELSRLEQRCGELRAACTAAPTHWEAAPDMTPGSGVLPPLRT